MDDLIEKLRAATEGSQALDKAVALAAFPNPHGNRISQCYTTTLDAALTLVPEGCRGVLDTNPGRHMPMRHYANIWTPPGPYSSGEISHTGKTDTPALALCIAALKALRPVDCDAATIDGSTDALGSVSAPEETTDGDTH